MTVGVLALQGAFAAHARVLVALGHATREVRTARDLDGLGGLVLPGGESTTQLKLLSAEPGFSKALTAFATERPVLCTCAGLILAARSVVQPAQESFGWLDVTVARNAGGRQLDSFEAVSDEGGLPLVFIRAPRILAVGPGVEVLARFDGEPILVRQGQVTAATFHPELTPDMRVHEGVFGLA